MTIAKSLTIKPPQLKEIFANSVEYYNNGTYVIYQKGDSFFLYRRVLGVVDVPCFVWTDEFCVRSLINRLNKK